MLVVFLKSILVFALILFVMRLMGKRQIGEMQPFELVITLMIAEVACIPLSDHSIPIYFGIIPILTLCTFQVIVTFIARKSIFVRKVLSGQPIIVINDDGIDYQALKKMNLNINDLIEAVQCAGFSDLINIKYAIFETNGKICVIEKADAEATDFLPLSLIIDGKVISANLKKAGASENQINTELLKNNIKSIKDVLYLDIRQDGKVYCCPKNAKYVTFKISITGGENW